MGQSSGIESSRQMGIGKCVKASYLGSLRSSGSSPVPEDTRDNDKAYQTASGHHHDRVKIWPPQCSAIGGGDA